MCVCVCLLGVGVGGEELRIIHKLGLGVFKWNMKDERRKKSRLCFRSEGKKKVFRYSWTSPSRVSNV